MKTVDEFWQIRKYLSGIASACKRQIIYTEQNIGFASTYIEKPANQFLVSRQIQMWGINGIMSTVDRI